MVKVSIIVLNFNQKEYTINCVESLLKQSFKDFEIIIIDNFSNDNSYELFIDNFKNNPKIKIFKTNENRGYAGGNNFGVEKANGDYIAILNNDTVVDENWLYWLIKGLESDENVKIVGAIMPILKNSEKIDFSKKSVTLSLTGATVFYSKKNEKKSDFERVFSAGGCAFIYDRSIIDLPFLNDYFAYGEDTYFNWFVNLKGYKVVKSINARGIHFHNAVRKNSNKRFNNYLLYLSERNLLINFYIFFSFKSILKISPLMFLRGAAYNLYYLNRIPSNFRAYLWILLHPKFIFKTRKKIQSERKVTDKEIIKLMSYKIYEINRITGFKTALQIFNNFSKFYCKIFNIKTVELS